jgi:6-phosphogluconolactonase
MPSERQMGVSLSPTRWTRQCHVYQAETGLCHCKWQHSQCCCAIRYLICEMGCTIEPLSYSAQSGELERLADSISTLPIDWPGTMSTEDGDSLGCTTADVHCSQDGKYVYGSNRVKGAEGSIAVFAVDPHTGGLSLVEHVGSGGATPRNFALHPSGEFMVVANQSSGNLVTFSVDQATGQLKRTGSIEGLHSPLCVQFVPTSE